MASTESGWTVEGDHLDLNHWTGRLFNASLDKLADDVRGLKPIRSRREMNDHNGVMARRLTAAIDDAVTALLSHKLEAREVQCGDCLTWFHKEANHTCAKQVKANRRAALNPQPEKETQG